VLDSTGRRVVEAAFELVIEGGLDAMSIQAVATRSDVTRGSIAFRFGTKDDLLVAVAMTLFDESLDVVQRYFDEHEPTGADVIDALSRLFAHRPAAAFPMMIAEALRPRSPIRVGYARFYDELRALFTARLRSSAAVRAPEVLAVVILGATLGINLQQQIAGGGIPRRAAFAMLREMLEQATAPDLRT